MSTELWDQVAEWSEEAPPGRVLVLPAVAGRLEPAVAEALGGRPWVGRDSLPASAAPATSALDDAVRRLSRGLSGSGTAAALDRLGMEARSGNLISGYDKIEAAARSGKVRMLIHAADAGQDGNRSLDQALRVGGGGPEGVIFPLGRTILSMALGRDNVVHIALTDSAAASRVQHALSRWRAFTDPDSGPKGGAAALRNGSANDLSKE